MSYSGYNNYQKYNKQAIAVGYDPIKDFAPKILATGKGSLAEKIINLAKENNIEIKKDEDLVKLLSLLEIDSYIPLEAYSALAEILGSIYKYNSQNKKSDIDE